MTGASKPSIADDPQAPVSTHSAPNRHATLLCVAVTPCLQRTLQFERIDLGVVNRARSVTLSHGGKGINAAYTAHLLGAAVRVTGFIGGVNGRALRAHLQRVGVAADFVPSRSPTRCCTTLIDLHRQHVTELVEEANALAAHEWASLERTIRCALPTSRLVAAAGALPKDAPTQFYADVARLAAEAERPVLLDTRGRALLATLAHHPLLVKLNREELAHTLGRSLASDEDLIDAVRELVALGAQWALVTDGARPAWLATGNGQLWRVTPPAINTYNPIGSGDAVLGGIGGSLLRGATMLSAIKEGIACGSAAALTLLPGAVDTSTVERLTQAVVLKAEAR